MNPSTSEQTNNSWYIPSQQQQQLEAAYQGRCILNRTREAIQHAHVIPFAHEARMFSFLLSRKLRVPITDDRYASQAAVNLIPLDATAHKLFDIGKWTLFPTMDALEECIVYEEAWIAYRHASIQVLGSDPGRPDYYFRDNNKYEVHQNDSFDPLRVFRLDVNSNTITSYLGPSVFPGSRPQGSNTDFPVLNLIASLPIVVHGCLPSFVLIASQSIYQQNLCAAAVYLMALWTWDLAQELPVNRPSWLQASPLDHGGAILNVPTFPPTPPAKVLHSHMSRFGKQEDKVDEHITFRPIKILTPPETPASGPSLWISHSVNDTSPHPQTVAVELTGSPSLSAFTRGMETCSQSFPLSNTEDAKEIEAEQKPIVPVGLDDNLERVRSWIGSIEPSEIPTIQEVSFEERMPSKGMYLSANDKLFLFGHLSFSEWKSYQLTNPIHALHT